ncbi:FAD-binding protein [Ornithinimicrobium sp. CNJ-824]|uniref:FAD-binding protein n=1 Tax=Ornithinimicrobium sp. CNJ-824 TaxID=1904966 RepID=UPI000B2B6191
MTATQTAVPVDTLATLLRGSVILPGDAGYDAARAVHNGMIDRRPAAIARCADEVDVSRAVLFAREHGMTVAVRGGGHNAGGLGVWDDALVVDLSPCAASTWTARTGRSACRAGPPGATWTTSPCRPDGPSPPG